MIEQRDAFPRAWHLRAAARRGWPIVAALLVTAAPAPAAAQIVNVQGALAKAPEQDGTTGQLELKLDWREGNNQLLDVSGSGSVLVRRGRLLALAIARAELGRGAGETFKQRTFEHVRARLHLTARVGWEAYAQHELDRFRRLTVRAVTGTGPTLQLVHTPALGLLAGASYMLEYERFDERMGVTDAGARVVQHRASMYLTGQQRLGEAAAIVETLYVQPRLDEPRDVRLLGELSITSKLSKHFALTDALVVAYDHTPPDGIRRADLQLRLGLLITL